VAKAVRKTARISIKTVKAPMMAASRGYQFMEGKVAEPQMQKAIADFGRIDAVEQDVEVVEATRVVQW
jgi:hypothetical protein